MVTRKRKQKRAAAKLSRAPLIERLPFLWKLATGTQAVGLCVGRNVWVANDKGDVHEVTRAGAILRSFKLPKPVHCLLVDDVWQYAGCNDGKIYDLASSQGTARVRPVFDLAPDMSIGWLEAFDGKLCVADAEGGLTIFDVEGNRLWERRDDAAGDSWMVRADASGVYHGSRLGLRAFDWSGALRWSVSEVSDVRFGAIAGDDILVTGGWGNTKRTTLHVVTKAGRRRLSLPLTPGPGGVEHNGAEACCAATDASGRRLFASCGGYLFCFADNGKPLWRAPTGCGSACNMEISDELLYVVTSDGTAACIDVRAPAIAAALAGVPASAPAP